MLGFQAEPDSSPAAGFDMELQPLPAAIEVPQAQDTKTETNNEEADPPIKWPVNICLAFAAQPVRTTNPASQAYAESGLALVMCAFSSCFLGTYGCFERKTRRAMHWLGVFLSVTAFFVRVTTESSVWLKCAGGTIYTLTWLAIVVPLVNRPTAISPVKEWSVKIWAKVGGMLS